MRALVALLAVAVTTSAARADVAPPGWRPSSYAPTPEPSHVVVLRESLASWMDASERERLDARRYPICRPPVRGYGAPRCPDARLVREVAVDRALRFFAAEVLAARGRGGEAERLRDLGPIHRRARNGEAAARLLEGDAALEPALRLARRGLEASLEEVATELGRVIRAAIDAGAPRERIAAAALEMLGQLARPMPAPSGARARPADPRRPPADPLFAQTLAVRARECFQPEVEARWRAVAVTVVAMGGPNPRLEVDASLSAPTRACLDRALRHAATLRRGEPAASQPMAIRIVVGPTSPLWGEPLDLASPLAARSGSAGPPAPFRSVARSVAPGRGAWNAGCDPGRRFT